MGTLWNQLKKLVSSFQELDFSENSKNILIFLMDEENYVYFPKEINKSHLLNPKSDFIPPTPLTIIDKQEIATESLITIAIKKYLFEKYLIEDMTVMVSPIYQSMHPIKEIKVVCTLVTLNQESILKLKDEFFKYQLSDLILYSDKSILYEIFNCNFGNTL